MPDLDATCSLDLGCPADDFAPLRRQHPTATVVVYANTSAAVKARADWMVTSVVRAGSCPPACQGQRSCGPRTATWPLHPGANRRRHAVFWNGACIVHDEFKGLSWSCLREQHPAPWCWCTLSRPRQRESSRPTWWAPPRLLKAVVEGCAAHIVATDNGILHRMRQLAPGKTLIEAPTAGNSATCKSCAHCP